jgi:hypothetical protein
VSNVSKSYVVLHHSFSTDHGTLDVPAIRAYHKSLGWKDVGYHFLLDRVGPDVEILFGRMPDQVGAHCHGEMNKKAYGICLIGNFDIAPPPIDMWEKAVGLCQWLMEDHGIDPSRVIGHREAQAMAGLTPDQRKSCPGKLFNLDKFRVALSS